VQSLAAPSTPPQIPKLNCLFTLHGIDHIPVQPGQLTQLGTVQLQTSSPMTAYVTLVISFPRFFVALWRAFFLLDKTRGFLLLQEKDLP